MVHSSGIGTYISSLVPIVIHNMNDCYFYLLGDKKKLTSFCEFSNVCLLDCNSNIYTIKEQLELIKLIPRNTSLYWAPHYNIPIFYRGKLLVTVHDVFHLAMKQYVQGAARRFYANIMFKFVKNKAKKILTVSGFSRSELIKYLNCNQKDIIVTHNGVDRTWFNLNDSKSLFNKPYLLYVGNVKPHKNLRNLIMGFELIKDKIPHNLIIVGKKEGFLTADGSIVELAKRNKDRIIFTGFIEENSLKNLVHNADVFVFPSLYEGFGLPPLEAMACGTPVAVSDIPSLREVCGEWVSYFDPNDIKSISTNIYNLITDDRKKKAMALYEKKRAAEFSWEKSAMLTEKVIRNLIL